MSVIKFLIGVDGGGTGTRAVLAEPDGRCLGRGQAGPSALGQGVTAAWVNVRLAIAQAFEAAGLKQADPAECALGLGLSGVNHEPWRVAFLEAAGDWGRLVLDTDGHVMLLGAHAGQAGLLLAAGTGSVAEVTRPDGSRAMAGGWGFPVADEGSGAWLGLRAMQVAQKAMDGRLPPGPLAQAVWAHCGNTPQALLAWCAQAGQFAYAQLAKDVFQVAQADPQAQALVARAAEELEALAWALDPESKLPVVVNGSVGLALLPLMSEAFRQRVNPPLEDPTLGALRLLRERP